MNKYKILLVVLVGILLVVCVRAGSPPSARYFLNPKELKYLRTLREVRANYGFFNAALQLKLHAATTDWRESDWQQEVEAALLGWEVTGKYLRSLDPPENYEALHARLVEISYNYEKCAKLTRQAFGLESLYIERVDVQKLGKASQVAEEIQSSWQELDPYLESLFRQLPGKPRQDDFEKNKLLASEAIPLGLFLPRTQGFFLSSSFLLFCA
ncbi:MAG: hypothetical protein U9M98_02625 [Patescibacteria group bacterium]|nr:hypothetical protein [Patescibacteria group bacterium]